MKNKIPHALSWLLLSAAFFGACASDPHLENTQAVASTRGLVAFWDFRFSGDTACRSYYDPAVVDTSFELFLRRIGDAQRYTPATWPYDTPLRYDDTGPFGRAIYFDRGYLYGAVPRSAFDQTPLDLHGKRPFTLIAWCKFVGQRHLVAGIWDEGGWNRYAGRRQVALFAGLFHQPGVIAHVSATGAASYPQSTAPGAQYARLRAIDGRPFEDHQWVAMAATYDPERGEVTAYLNGVQTPLAVTDPVTQDVYQYADPLPANPFRFGQPIYAPPAFVIKYNGYPYRERRIVEHRARVDLDARTVIYERDTFGAPASQRFRLLLDIRREGQRLFASPVGQEVAHGDTVRLPATPPLHIGDAVWTQLEEWRSGQWQAVGAPITRRLLAGAPFTFGRALGLGSEELDHGSQLFLDGVAVFNRVLSEAELRRLSLGLDRRAPPGAD